MIALCVHCDVNSGNFAFTFYTPLNRNGSNPIVTMLQAQRPRYHTRLPAVARDFCQF